MTPSSERRDKSKKADVSASNYFIATQTLEEFIIQFGVKINEDLNLTHSVMMAPPTAKRLAATLGYLISRYEEERGRIPTQADEKSDDGPEK